MLLKLRIGLGNIQSNVNSNKKNKRERETDVIHSNSIVEFFLYEFFVLLRLLGLLDDET